MEIKLNITSNIKGKIFEKRVLDVVNELGLDANVTTVNYSPFSSERSFYTPTLYINGELVSSGKVLSKEEITHYFL